MITQTTFDSWMPTAIELWNDEKFLRKRIEEQRDYLFLLSSEQRSDRCNRDEKRYKELVEVANFQLTRFKDQLKLIKL